MSTVEKKSDNMGTPFFREFKKQASFYLKEKIKTARLALTDVTPAQLLTEEATNANPWAPDTKTMSTISRAAFEVDDYWRIVDILHKKLERFDRTNWRISYKALVILEHLLTHGPESVAEEFQSDTDAIHEMESFQFIDERGFNWGLTVRKKSERVQTLLERGPLLKEERHRSRKLSREIQGFGSFCNRSSTELEISKQQSFQNNFGRSNSIFNDHHRDQFLFSEEASTDQPDKTQITTHDASNSTVNLPTTWDASSKMNNLQNSKSRTSFKENTIPAVEIFQGERNELESMKELNPLLCGEKYESKTVSLVEEDHPFNSSQEHHTTASLLSTGDEIM